MADEDFEVDPAIAEAMGFSGFGMQQSKKRKFDINDGFIDPELAESAQTPMPHSNGANSLPLGTKRADRTSLATNATKPAPVAVDSESKALAASSSLKPSEASLDALRHGVRNERGDIVYFLPSFLEDPWEKLRQQK